MKTFIHASITTLTILTMGLQLSFAQEIDRKSHHEISKRQALRYCGMQYEQDTSKIKRMESDTLQKVKPQEIRVKQSKKQLPEKTAKPEPMKKND